MIAVATAITTVIHFQRCMHMDRACFGKCG